MTANVVALKTEQAKQVDEVVELLARALDEARAGDVVAVGIVAVRPDQHANVCFSDHWNATALMGGAAMLSARLAANVTTETET